MECYSRVPREVIWFNVRYKGIVSFGILNYKLKLVLSPGLPLDRGLGAPAEWAWGFGDTASHLEEFYPNLPLKKDEGKR